MLRLFVLTHLIVSAALASQPAGAQGQAAEGWSTVSASTRRFCALDVEGRAFCWDDSSAEGAEVTSPVRFITLSLGATRPCERLVASTPSCTRTCGLTSDGRAYCWGANQFGQIGDGTLRARGSPVAVRGGLQFSTIHAGGGFTCGIARQDLYCWGTNEKGELALGRADTSAHSVPRPVARGVQAVATSTTHACALNAVGQAYCWGEDYHGRLGSDAAHEAIAAAAVPVNGVSRFVAVTTGGTHACGLTETGEARCWGSNLDGQLADDPARVPTRRTPASVAGPAFVLINASPSGHTCGLDRDGYAWCWGRAADGELGTGSIAVSTCYATPCITQPTRVSGEQRFRVLSTGTGFTCGVSVDGELLCWGRVPGRSGRVDTPVRITMNVPATRTDALEPPRTSRHTRFSSPYNWRSQ